SRTDSSQAATRAANARWLPQAESACDRLLTVSHCAEKYRRDLEAVCGLAETSLPELGAEKAKALKIFIEAQCREGASKLADISNHLESAYADWHRFIMHNCDQGECERIFASLTARRNKLESALPQRGNLQTCQELQGIDTG